MRYSLQLSELAAKAVLFGGLGENLLGAGFVFLEDHHADGVDDVQAGIGGLSSDDGGADAGGNQALGHDVSGHQVGVFSDGDHLFLVLFLGFHGIRFSTKIHRIGE